MSDQLRWWKLWTSVMTDDKIRSLSLDDVARYCLLGVYIRQHGERGSIVSRRPHDGLRTLWRHQRVTAVEATLQRLPGILRRGGRHPWDPRDLHSRVVARGVAGEGARDSMIRVAWYPLLGVALVLTVPVVLVGCFAGVMVSACERWLLIVGALGAKVGWWRR